MAARSGWVITSTSASSCSLGGIRFVVGELDEEDGPGDDTQEANEAPLILTPVAGATLSEDGLDDGNEDDGEPSNTTASGTIGVSDVGTLAFAFGVPPGNFTSGGSEITW